MNTSTIRRLGWLLLVVGLAVAGAGMGVAVLTAPDWYVATARVKADTWFEGDTNAFYDPFFIQKEFELIQSLALLSNAIARLDFQAPAGRKLSFLKDLDLTDARAFIQSSFNLRPVRGTSLLQIQASHDDPDAAALMANAIAAAYCNLPPERLRHYTEAECAYMRREARAPGWQEWDRTNLLAASKSQCIVRVKVEMIDSFTSQVSLQKRLNLWLQRSAYRLPGPPAHPHGRLSLGLVVLGLILCAIGLGLLSRQTA